MLHRSGTGRPAVVFLPGAALVGLDYLRVHERAAELTTSVIYDRAGTGWSDPAPLPRTAAEVTGELRDLLRAAELPAPYVLAGHSLGGAYARHFAQRFPREVAGLLLLDPFHEELVARAPRRAREMLARMKDPSPRRSRTASTASSTTRATAGSTRNARTPCSRPSRTYSNTRNARGPRTSGRAASAPG
jgi:pimeloyl-ACP methyl ester carboxylesterase